MSKRLCLLLLAVMATGWGEDRWLRLHSDRFEIVTNAGAGTGRDVLRRFEQIRNLFESRTGRGSLTPLPVRVFVFKGEGDFQPYKVNPNVAGYYQAGHDRDYIAMQSTGADTYRVVYHEYTHLLLRHAGYRVPVWFNEGTAEMFSTAEVGTSEVRIGDLIPAHILTLRDERMLDLATLTSVGHDSPYYNERGKTGIFYAQSWALVHMLNFSPEYRTGLANFIRLMLDGEDPVRAFQQAYGKSPGAILQDLSGYVSRARFTGVRYKSDKFDVGKVPPVAMSEAETQLALADLLLVIGRVADARMMYGKAEAAYPDDPMVQLALGQFAFRTEDYHSARRFFETAIQRGGKYSTLFYEYAMTLRQMHESEESVITNLETAVALDDRNFDAHQYLGFLHLQGERYLEALPHLKRATELQPGRASVWESLALAYQRSGDKQHARAAAQSGRKVASGPEEAARLDALIDLIETDADKIVAAPPEKLPEKLAAAPSPLRIEGTLTQVDCIGNQARLHIATRGSRTLLLVRDPRAVHLTGAGGLTSELACGPVPSRPVVVEYLAEPNRTYGVVGVVVSVDFR